MNYAKLKPWEKIEKLETGVMQDTPSEVAKIYEDMNEVVFTARALGLACRYRGLEMVKVLVERGASFSINLEKLKPQLKNIGYFRLELYGDENYSLGLLSNDTRRETYELVNIGKSHCGVNLVSINERLRTLNFFLKNKDKINFKADEFLFYAYMSDDMEMIDFLKKMNVIVSERLIKVITEGANSDDWLNYCFLTGKLPDEKFMRVMGSLIGECGGKKLHFTEYFWEMNNKRFMQPKFFGFLLENFNQSKMNKGRLMKGFIDSGNVSCLELAAEKGWLKLPKKRDEMIAYATEKGKTECAAYLLDFKNRTANLAAERAKAEKKLEREFNADPNSVTELKKNWSFKRNDDGTLVITGYKGSSTVLDVPQKIGNAAVTEIGNWALSPHAPRIKEPTREFRKTITKITLPEGLKKIGENAFCDLISLESVNIPKGVTSIGERAFGDCVSLKKIIVPDSVTYIDDNAFSMLSCGKAALEYVRLPRRLGYFNEKCKWWRVYLFHEANCPKLVVGVPHAPHVEEFCEHNKIKFEYYDTEDRGESN